MERPWKSCGDLLDLFGVPACEGRERFEDLCELGALLLRFYPFNCLLMLVDETLGYSGALVMSEPNMIGKMNQTVLAEYAASLGVKDLADYEVLP